MEQESYYKILDGLKDEDNNTKASTSNKKKKKKNIGSNNEGHEDIVLAKNLISRKKRDFKVPLEYLACPSFSVLTYNILAQYYIKSNFPYCDKQYLSYEYRLKNLVAELRHHNADIMCLQELEKESLEKDLQLVFENLGYNFVFRKRPTIKKDGCCVFYKKDKFSLVTSKSLEFVKMSPHKIPDMGLPENFDPKQLQKGNVANVVVLKLTDRTTAPRNKAAGLIIANCHLYYKATDQLVREVQWTQLDTLLSFLEQQHKQHPYPVLLCGDFNTQPNAPLYQYIIQQSKKLGFALTSTYSNYNPTDPSRNGEPHYTNYTEKFKDCLDYLWFERDKLEVASLLELPLEEQLNSQVALPNELYSSDHIALMATYYIKSPHK